MKHTRFKRGLAVALGLLLTAAQPLAQFGADGPGVSYAYTGSATVKAASLNVRSGAGTNYSAVGKLSSGQSVTIRSEQTGTDGNKWYQIQYTGSDGTVKTGYVSSVYIKIPVSYTTDSDFEAYLNSQGFPESYKEGLRQLHAQYPNWVFRSLKTGLDWNTVIENESLPPRNLVNTGSISSWKSVESGAYNWDNSTWTGFDGSNWVAASDGIIRYYMDPRNFLDETYIFQFLSQEYNGSTQTRQGLETLVKDSFLSGTTDSTGTGGGEVPPGDRGEAPATGREVPAPRNPPAALTTTASTDPAFRGAKPRPAAALLLRVRAASAGGTAAGFRDAERSGIGQRHGQPGRAGTEQFGHRRRPESGPVLRRRSFQSVSVRRFVAGKLRTEHRFAGDVPLGRRFHRHGFLCGYHHAGGRAVRGQSLCAGFHDHAGAGKGNQPADLRKLCRIQRLLQLL